MADMNASILIVDDYKTMLRIIRNILSQFGFLNVDEATNGSLALLKLKERKYDLVISPATIGEAPKINESEPDDASLIWTFLHTPSIFYPLFSGPNGLPYGLHFVSKRKKDYRLIEAVNYLIKKNILSNEIKSV